LATIPLSEYLQVTFSEADFQQLFTENIQASDIGFAIQAVRDDGLQAARGGVDFSQLFLGLSFFLLVAADNSDNPAF
jgi:putative ABC transport system permease protein